LYAIRLQFWTVAKLVDDCGSRSKPGVTSRVAFGLNSTEAGARKVPSAGLAERRARSGRYGTRRVPITAEHVSPAMFEQPHSRQLRRGRLMNDMERKDLSRAEWKVMKIVWELRKAMAREVYTIACEQNSWTPATVKTILKRLVEKGYVSTTQVGNGFVYRPAQSALSTLQSAADTLLTNSVEGVTGPLLAHMVERMSLSEDDLDSLQKLIDSKKKSLKTRGKK
jgi:BlaI family transcriptional regulator, penicillinase repressor